MSTTGQEQNGKTGQDAAAALDFASASRTASFAAALAGMPSRLSVSSAGSVPLSSAATRAAHPASVIWVPARLSTLSFFSPPAGGGATTAARPALVAERIAEDVERPQRGKPPQGRREGHQPRVSDGGVG